MQDHLNTDAAKRAEQVLEENRRESKQIVATDALTASEGLIEERSHSKQVIAADALRALEDIEEEKRNSKVLLASDALMASGGTDCREARSKADHCGRCITGIGRACWRKA